MTYRVDITARAARDLKNLYRKINAGNSAQAQRWFNGLEKAVFSLQNHPHRCSVTPESADLRHLLYGSREDTYRIIFMIDDSCNVVTILHIRHGSREPLKGTK